ncbi:hypothetical protein GCM10023176_41480 [Micromonospora coerulea]|uniref:Diguanylate cyclase n=1 Tax=Micromonospora coerulea TaxID=47856 RepID=A0ABP8SUN1_9ACTN
MLSRSGACVSFMTTPVGAGEPCPGLPATGGANPPNGAGPAVAPGGRFAGSVITFAGKGAP